MVRHVVLCWVVVAALLGSVAVAGAFTVTPVNPPLPEASIDADLVFLGGQPGSQIYRYDFYVRNISIEPSVQTVMVFFDSDPETGEFLGDRSDLTSKGVQPG